MTSDTPPRPRWNHQCVKEAAAQEFADEVRQWATSYGVVNENADDREFVAVLALTLIESPDAYHAGRYLEDFIGWPVNGDLIRVLDRAYARMRFITSSFVHDWVTENNIRFPAKKGDKIRCKIGDVEINGSVVEVIRREARGMFLPNNHERVMVVLAEEIQQVTQGKVKPKRVRPPQPPESA